MVGLRQIGDIVSLMIAVLCALLLIPALVYWFSAPGRLGIAVVAMIFMPVMRAGRDAGLPRRRLR